MLTCVQCIALSRFFSYIICFRRNRSLGKNDLATFDKCVLLDWVEKEMIELLVQDQARYGFVTYDTVLAACEAEIEVLFELYTYIIV